MVGFLDNPMMSMYGTAEQPGFMSNPGLGPFATNLGMALIAAGSGGGAPRSRFADAMPYLGQAVQAPMQMRQQEMMQKLYGAQVGKMEADVAKQKAQDEARIGLSNSLRAPSMMPMTEMEGNSAGPFAAVPQAQRQMAVSLLDAGVEPEKVLPSLMPTAKQPIFQDKPISADQTQKMVSYDNGTSWQPFGEAQPRWEPKGAESEKPLTEAAKAKADLQRGLIDQATYDAIVGSAGFNERTRLSDGERKWRQELQPQINAATDLVQQTNTIETALKNKDGTGDIAAIVAFNKLLDPGAVVREADVALTLQAQGLAERLGSWVNNKTEGEILPQELRGRMLELSKKIKESSSELLRDRVLPYRPAIEGEGAKFGNIVPDVLSERLGWNRPRLIAPTPQVRPANPNSLIPSAPQITAPGIPPLPDNFVLVPQ
jgi:hypothetical protein